MSYDYDDDKEYGGYREYKDHDGEDYEDYNAGEYRDYDYDEDVDPDEYKSPDGDYGDEPSYGEADDDLVEASDSYIDSGAEWRDFGDGVSKSRVGMARRIDLVDEDLGTVIFDDKFKKLEQITRTPEDIYRLATVDTVKRYNLLNDLVSDSLKIMQYIKQYNKGLRFRSPKLITLALSVISNGRVDMEKLDRLSELTQDESISKIDIIRYISFIEGLRNIAKK